MSYRIELIPEARSEVKALPGDVRCQALELLGALAVDPRTGRARELSQWPALYRIWLAKRWRVAYEVSDDQLTVVVLCVRRNERIDFDSLPPWAGDSTWPGCDAEPARPF